MRMLRILIILGLLVVMTSLAACGGGGDEGDQPNGDSNGAAANAGVGDDEDMPSGDSNGARLSLDDAIKRSRELYDDFLGILKDINDPVSARAAAPKIRGIIEEFDRLALQVSYIPGEDLIKEAENAGFNKDLAELTREMQRIMLNPELATVLGEVFAGFEGSGPFGGETGQTSEPVPTLIPGAESTPGGAPIEGLNALMRIGLPGFPSSVQQCFKDKLNSLGLGFDSWQRAEFDFTVEQYTEIAKACGVDGLP